MLLHIVRGTTAGPVNIENFDNGTDLIKEDSITNTTSSTFQRLFASLKLSFKNLEVIKCNMGLSMSVDNLGSAYYHGTLSNRQVSATHLKTAQLQVKSTHARSSNELRWLHLKIWHQHSSVNDGHQGDMPYSAVIWDHEIWHPVTPHIGQQQIQINSLTDFPVSGYRGVIVVASG